MTEKQRISKLQEKRICNSIEDAKLTPRSGAIGHLKSDILTSRFRIEAKTKMKPSKQITVKKEWWDKITSEAYDTNKIPVLAVSFGDGKDLVILDLKKFIELVE